MLEQSIFIEALEREDPAQRSAFLDQACGGDTALRQRIERLLGRHEQSGSFLDAPVAEFLPTLEGSPSEEPVTAMIDPGRTEGPSSPPALREMPSVAGYEVLSVLGRGGMGVVYKARQLGLNRLVALKMIRAGSHAGPRELARFRAEGEAVARLQHPNIVQIYEVGEQDGLPFFSLECVDGGSLDKHLNGTPRPGREAAELAETLARAVHHAHQHGIVHRDLKPANVLLAPHPEPASRKPRPPDKAALDSPPAGLDIVSEYEFRVSDYAPKITDFGLAKLLEGDTGQTQTGAIMGTPSYMAPEQAEGRIQDIGATTDVFALGAILYELLTGRPPFKGSSLPETLEQVRCQESVPPSRLQPTTPHDLETICLKCLRKESRQRYASALDLADDLRRFLDGEPIQARPVGAWERAAKWAKRRPAVAALAALSLLVTVVGAGLVLWQWREAVAARGTADEKRAQAEAAEGRALDKAEAEARARHSAVEARQQETVARRQAEEQLYLSNISLAQRDWQANNLSRAEDLLNDCPVHLRGWEYYYLKRLQRGALLQLRKHGPAQVHAVAFSPDSRRLASAAADCRVQVCDAATGDDVLELLGHDGAVAGVAFSPDGKRLATGSHDRTVRLWDAASGAVQHICRGHTAEVTGVAFSPDGRWVASSSRDRTLKVWEAATGALRVTLQGHTAAVKCLGFSPDGKRLASGTAMPDTTVRIWDPATGKELLTLPRHGTDVNGVAFSPDGKSLATINGVSTQMRLYDPETGKQEGWLNFDGAISLMGVAYRPDGKQIGVATRSMQLRVYEFETQRTNILRGHTGHALSIAFSPDGRRLASGASNGEVLTWDAAATPEAITLLSGGYTSRVAYSPEGRFLAWATNAPVGDDLKPIGHGEVRLADAVTGRELRCFVAHEAAAVGLVFSRDGELLASAGRRGDVKVWQTATGRELLHVAADAARVPVSWFVALAFSTDGKQLLLAGKGGAVQAWDVPSGRERPTHRLKVRAPEKKGDRTLASGVLSPFFPAALNEPRVLAFSADGRRLAVADLRGLVLLFDPATGEQVGRLSTTFEPAALAFRPDGCRLAIAHGGGRSVSTITVYDVEQAREIRSFSGHAQRINQLAFSPDGRRLASASWDNTVKFWDADAGRELLTLAGHTNVVFGVAFSSDGRRLASAAGDGRVKVWDGTPTREVFTMRRPNVLVLGLAFSRDGRYLASTQGVDGRAYVWDALTGRQVRSLGVSTGEQVGTAVAFSPDGERVALARSGPGRKGSNITVWKLAGGVLLSDFKAHDGAIMELAFTPDGRRLVSASHDRTVKVWDAATCKPLFTFTGHVGMVHGLAVRPDGERIASGSGDGTAKVWDAADGRILLSLRAPRGSPGGVLVTSDLWTALLNLRGHVMSMGGVAFSPDGRRLATCSLGPLDVNCQVIVWDATTGRQLQVFRRHRGFIYRVAFSPDGRRVASAGIDRTVRIWEADTGQEVLVLPAHDGPVYRLAFSPDGKRLASVGGDSCMRVWDVTLSPKGGATDALPKNR